MNAPAKVDVLAVISAVLAKHRASLLFSVPAVLWVDGQEIGEVWHDEDDGSSLEFVDPALATQAVRHG